MSSADELGLEWRAVLLLQPHLGAAQLIGAGGAGAQAAGPLDATGRVIDGADRPIVLPRMSVKKRYWIRI